MVFLSVLHLFLCLSSWAWGVCSLDTQENIVRNFFEKNGSPLGETGSTHTNNWAVLVCSSRYWFNYRHMANALGMYRTVKRLGIPDSNIILMLADDASCNSRNKFPGSVYANPGRHLDLYGDNIEVDYRGYEVTVENFIRVLTGRMDPSVPRSKRLLTDERSNIFVYMTGHGGNEFLKFQDNEEISAFDIADAFEQMYQKKRYNEIFFMIDTCQANTMYSKLYSPNILATGSSNLGENSYSHANDNDIGVAVIDAFTHYVLEFMEKINKTSQVSMQELLSSIDVTKINSHPGVRTDLFKRPLDKTRITDFFGGVAQVEIVPPLDIAAMATPDEAILISDSGKKGKGNDDNASQEHAQLHSDVPSDSPVQNEPPITLHSILVKLSNWTGEKEWKNTRAWASVTLIGLLASWAASKH